MPTRNTAASLYTTAEPGARSDTERQRWPSTRGFTCTSRRPRARGATWSSGFFGKLTDKAIRRGVFHSVPDLINAIDAYLTTNNTNPQTVRVDRHHRADP
jgi:hypothetical protein